MAAKKKTTKRTTKRKSRPKAEKIEKEPEFMIQLSDPKMLRKDLLEALREVIIFMQGYEKFRLIQEEKVALFNTLKSEVRQLNLLAISKLRKYLPKGKVRAIFPKRQEEEPYERTAEMPNETVSAQSTETEQQEKEGMEGLAELETQLRSIERQLQGIK